MLSIPVALEALRFCKRKATLLCLYITYITTIVTTSFPGLSYEDEARDEKAWSGPVT
jgi:hypothetical protein